VKVKRQTPNIASIQTSANQPPSQIGQAQGQISTTSSGLLGGLGSGQLGEVIGTVTNGLGNPLGLVGGLTGSVNGVAGNPLGLVSGLTGTAGGLVGGLTGTTGGLLGGLTGGNGGLLGGLTGGSGSGGLLNGMTGGQGGVGNIIGGLTGMAGGLAGGITNTASGIISNPLGTVGGLTTSPLGVVSGLVPPQIIGTVKGLPIVGGVVGGVTNLQNNPIAGVQDVGNLNPNGLVQGVQGVGMGGIRSGIPGTGGGAVDSEMLGAGAIVADLGGGRYLNSLGQVVKVPQFNGVEGLTGALNSQDGGGQLGGITSQLGNVGGQIQGVQGQVGGIVNGVERLSQTDTGDSIGGLSGLTNQASGPSQVNGITNQLNPSSTNQYIQVGNQLIQSEE